mgnify:CR=1 FL=1
MRSGQLVLHVPPLPSPIDASLKLTSRVGIFITLWVDKPNGVHGLGERLTKFPLKDSA